MDSQSTEHKNLFEKGLSKILYGNAFPPKVGQENYFLLVKGKPGAGKTIFCLHLFNSYLQKYGAEASGLLCYGTENYREHDQIAAHFKLDFKNLDFPTSKISDFQHSSEKLKEILNKDPLSDKKLCIFIDGFTMFNDSASGDYREIANTVIDTFKDADAFIIIALEDEPSQITEYFKYAVDGIISIEVSNSAQRHRYIEIEKLRYMDYARGKHGLEFFTPPDKKTATLRIYPKLSAQLYYLKSQQVAIEDHESSWQNYQSDHYYNTGIKNLDSIITNNKQSSSLTRGDTIFIACEPGINKAEWGLSFLAQSANDIMDGPNLTSDKKHDTIWLNFGPSTIEKQLRKPPLMNDFSFLSENYFCYDKVSSNRISQGSELSESQDNRDKTSGIVQHFNRIRLTDLNRPYRTLHPGRSIDCLIGILDKYSNSSLPVRVVVDGISNLCMDLGNSEALQEYIVNLNRILNNCNSLSMVFVDLPYSYKSMNELSIEWMGEVDFAGHLRWFEINNNKHLSFSLLKSRYSKYNSKPFHVAYDKTDDYRYSIQLKDEGWPMVSMLGGTAESIHEAKAFLKFFDQSYSNLNLHTQIFGNFEERYPEDQTFKYVLKRNPNPQHWSFLGYAGVGHSNTKVVLLKNAVTDILSENDALLEYPVNEWENHRSIINGNLPGQEAVDSRSYSLWGFFKRESEAATSNPGKILPVFSDFSILCCQDNPTNMSEISRALIKDTISIDYKETPVINSWYHLFDLNKKFIEEKNQEDCLLHPPWIRHLFSMPSLTLDSDCFFNFFLEILFDFSDTALESIFEYSKHLDGLIDLIESEPFIDTINFLRLLVTKQVSASPLEKINYQTSYYSRRWYSEVNSFSYRDQRLISLDKLIPEKYLNLENFKPETNPSIKFSISTLPSKTEGKHGLSSIDFYSAGVITQALAPETAFMFISEISSVNNSIKRFSKRRGIPIRRDHWVDLGNHERKKDIQVLDEIIESNKYFFPSWIPYLKHYEGQINEFCRKIFIAKKYANNSYDFTYSIQYLRELLLGVVITIQADLETKS